MNSGNRINLEGKRLLHLGGGLFQLPSLECAKRLGVEIILVDHDPEAPGIGFADVFEQISTRDRDAVLEVAKKYEIDGVMTYASDSSVLSVAHVAEMLGLPGNTVRAAETICRKDLFRDLQKTIGLPHPAFVSASTTEEVSDQVGVLGFPVVVKPVDAAGTRGQTVVHQREEIGSAVGIALANSPVKRVIVEEFIVPDLLELDGDVWFTNGRLNFRHYGHNYFLKERISNVPSGEMFPGFFGTDISHQIDQQFIAIIDALGLHAGCMNFDALSRDGIVHLLDVGLRSGGNFVPDAIKLSTGFDMTEAAICSALGVDYPNEHLYCADPAPVATYLIGSRTSGVYEEVTFDPEIEQYLVEMRSFRDVGSHLDTYDRADMAAGIAFFKFPDMETMRREIERIEDTVKLRISSARPVSVRENARRGERLIGDYKRFPELVSPFLREKLEEAESAGNAVVTRVISKQYLELSDESSIRSEEGLKHYEARERVQWEGHALSAVERLYKRVIMVEPLYQCIANCRFCLRRNYDLFHQSTEDIRRIARYVGEAPGHEDLREVLITGGDPFLSPDKVNTFLESLAEFAPQIRIARVATRVPVQQPDRVDRRVLDVLSSSWPFRIEVATQINHASELFPEVKAAYQRIRDVALIYNQSVLLRGVNDTLEELIDLCDGLRELSIENHYLFHCVPIGGLNHLRTPLTDSIDLAWQLASNGRVAGRSKPQFCIMTSIGKITPYEGTIVEVEAGRYLLRSAYTYAERRAWNPTWELPENVIVDESGHLCVWYEDAKDSSLARVAGSSS